MTYDTARTKAQDAIAKLAPALPRDPDESFRVIYWRLADVPRDELLTIAAFLALQAVGQRATSDMPRLMGEGVGQ